MVLSPFSLLRTQTGALQTGLFSAAVSVLLTVSVLDLKPNSQDISAFYLANIYQVLADPNVTVSPLPIPSTLPILPPVKFSPPRSAIWVNSLWFLTLVINLTCALLATSLHQWSRRYIRFTQEPLSVPQKRARLRWFFRGGMDRMHLPLTAEALPALIHLSLFLFFAGLAIFLFNIDHSVFISVIWSIVGSTAVYLWMTVMPFFRHDSPYYAPLSSAAWFLFTIFSYVLHGVFTLITSGRFVGIGTRGSFRCWIQNYWSQISWDVQKAAEETTSTQSSKIDLDILDSTIGGALGDDKTLEAFFEAIPGFFNSRMVKNAKGSLRDEVRSKIVESLEGFLDSNLSSNSVNEETKIRRIIICMNATKEIGKPPDFYSILSRLGKGNLGEDDSQLEKLFAFIPEFLKSIPEEARDTQKPYPELRDALDGFLRRTLPPNTVIESVKIRRLDIYLNAIKVIYGLDQVHTALSNVLLGMFGKLPTSIEIARTLSGWFTDPEDTGRMSVVAPDWVADTLIHVPTQKRDKDWIAFVKDQFDMSERVLEENIAHGDDSVLLAILIHVTGQAASNDSRAEILRPLSKFAIHNTHLDLQNEFCALWNEKVQEADKKPAPSIQILRSIRQVYIALHHGTDASPTAFGASTWDRDPILSQPSSYPLCTITHRPTQPIPGNSAAPQQAIPPSAHHGPLAPPSPSSIADPVHIAPSDTTPSIHGSVPTVNSREHDETRDPNPSTPTETLPHVEQSGTSTPQA